MSALHLCANCLQGDARGVPVGQEQGSQRDPYRATVALCAPCSEALTTGDFSTLHERFATERTVRQSAD